MTTNQLRELVVYQIKCAFGFASAFCKVVLLASPEDHGYCVDFSWAVGGNGYSWNPGEVVVRIPTYDLSV